MWALLIFAVAFAIRLIHIWHIRPSPFFDVLMGDANGYDLWAQRLAAGDWIGSEVFYQAPLYPYFLGVVYAIFGHDLLTVRLIQAMIGSASCVLLGLAGARLFSKPVGLAAGLGLALWSPAIFFDSLLQKSVLDMFFMCLAIYLIARIISGAGRWEWMGLGAAMGALALTRENALLLIAVVAFWIVWRAPASAGAGPQRRLKPSLSNGLFFFVAGLTLVFAPVVARNYAVDGGFYLTTSQFGSNFYIGNNPNADGTYASIRFGRGAPEFERIDAKEVAEQAVGRTLTASEVSSYWTRRALGFITSEPIAWLRLTGRKILLLLNRSEMLDTEAEESYAEWSTPLAILGWAGHFGLLVPLAVFGAIAMWPDRRRLWVIYALAITYAASVVMFFVFARYRYPLVPFLLLFAAAGAWSIRNQRPAWVVAAAVAVLANWPVLDSRLMMAITENNLGTALQERKRYDEAIAHHERAIAIQPGYAPAYNNLGAALKAAGRTSEAVDRYKQALELKPDFASASYNLANALLEQGQAGASAAGFREALKSAPNSVEAHNNLGAALAAKGDAAGAIAEFRAAVAIDDRSAKAHRNLGNLLIDIGARSEGLRHLERASALEPGGEATYDIGTILLEDQNFGAAAARFEAALKVRPDWAEAHNNLGIALASQGRIAEALTHFEQAVALNPSLDNARANLAQAKSALKK